MVGNPRAERSRGVTRGRAGLIANERRFAGQVARLLDAGAPWETLDPFVVLDLLQLRGPERGGLARSTQYRWRADLKARAARGEDLHAMLDSWLRVHEPYARGRARLRDTTRTDTELAELGLRTLLLGAGAGHLDLVLAEGRAVADAAAAAGAPTVELEDMLARTLLGGRLSAQSLRQTGTYQAAHLLRALPIDQVVDVLGQLRAPEGPWWFRQPPIDPVRWLRLQNAALHGLDPVTARAHVLGPAQLPVGKRAALADSPSGRAALVEWACTTLELTYDAVPKDPHGPSPELPAPSHALAVLREYARELTARIPAGRPYAEEEEVYWSREHWAELLLRVLAASQRFHTPPPAELDFGPDKSAGARAAFGGRLLCGLRPAAIEALESARLPELVAGSRHWVPERWTWGVPEAWRERRTGHHDGWLVQDEPYWHGWRETVAYLAASANGTAEAEARSATRALQTLAGALERGRDLGPEARMTLLRELEGVAGLLLHPPDDA